MSRDEDSKDIINRAMRDSETMLGSSLQRAADHFRGLDRDGTSPDDPAEKWGRIIGRASAILIALAGLYVLLR